MQDFFVIGEKQYRRKGMEDLTRKEERLLVEALGTVDENGLVVKPGDTDKVLKLVLIDEQGLPIREEALEEITNNQLVDILAEVIADRTFFLRGFAERLQNSVNEKSEQYQNSKQFMVLENEQKQQPN